MRPNNLSLSFSDGVLTKQNNFEAKNSLAGKELFIAFHNVSFQDPTKISDKLLIENLSFSVLPGEFVSITGESSPNLSPFIFELILRYYVVHFGDIYISGTKIELISKGATRKLISIFKQNFGLINGNIYENLNVAMQDKSPEKINKIAEKFGLFEELDWMVYGEHGELNISQELCFRVQIARLYARNPKVVLIETPCAFENDFAVEIFKDFVENISKEKTIIMQTNDMKTLIYSDKILYLGKDETRFGTHAELSKFDAYGNFLKILRDF
ncbi:hypothetical protein FACS1894113_5070 [Alphaproteobacteria bacterium]|nr:hypothetical protein FACS1894113_5070 [Alphaproteobacteria bacterium]